MKQLMPEHLQVRQEQTQRAGWMTKLCGSNKYLIMVVRNQIIHAQSFLRVSILQFDLLDNVHNLRKELSQKK